MANLATEKLLGALKRDKPSRVVVYIGDKEREVAVRGGRNSASQTLRAVEALGAWSRVELLNKGGALLSTVENTDPAGELQELGAPTGMNAQVERMLVIVLKAQREALAFRDSEVRTIMQAQAEVLREQSAAVKSLTALYQAQVETVRATAEIQADAAIAAATKDGDWAQLVEALPTILQAVPVLRSLIAGPAPAPNGAPKKGA
jgi:hypothetical protein